MPESSDRELGYIEGVAAEKARILTFIDNLLRTLGPAPVITHGPQCFRYHGPHCSVLAIRRAIEGTQRDGRKAATQGEPRDEEGHHHR